MKKFVSGLILGLLIATASVVAANSEVVAKFTSFNFVINGESKQLENQPVVVNGSSYLPVRELANLLGYDVTYKADTKTIELNSNTSSTDLSGTGETDEASYNEDASEPSKTNIKIVVGDRSTQSSAYVKNGVPLLHSGSIREIFSALDIPYESTSITEGGFQIRTVSWYEFKLDDPSHVSIDGTSVKLTTPVFNEPVGLSGHAQYLPLDLFEEQGLINYDLSDGVLTVTAAKSSYEMKWITIRELANDYGVDVTVGKQVNLSNNGITVSFSTSELKTDGLSQISTEKGPITVGIFSGRSYILLEDIVKIGLISN
jgi:hypothetical protein